MRTPSEAELRRLVSGKEPAELSNYIMQARNNVAYVSGSGVIDLKQFEFGVGRHLLRDVEMPDHHIYLTLDDYMPESFKLQLGISATSAEIADFLIGQHSVRDMLIALAQLNRLRSIADQCDDLRQAYAQTLRPERAGHLLNAVMSNQSEPHIFLARQTIMLAARDVILRGEQGVAQPDASPLMTAVMLTHATASSIGPLDERGPQVWDGMPVSALMELVANASFNTSEWWVSQLDRLWRTWIRHGSSAERMLARAPFEQLVYEALGLEIGAIALLSLSLAVPAQNWRYPDPILNQRQFVNDAAPSDISKFLSYVGADIDDLRNRLLKQKPPWGFLPFEETPVIDLGSEVLVFDADFLMNRATTGLYWAVSRLENSRGGDYAFRAWSKGHGLAVEATADEQIRGLAPRVPILGSGNRQTTYFTEHDLARAYPGAKKGRAGKRSDAVVWLPSCWLIFEIAVSFVKVSARQGLDIEAFRDDVDKLMKELAQLDGTVKDLLRDGGAALMGFPAIMPIQPILVQGGFFPIHPIISAYIDDRIKRARLFAQSSTGSYERHSRVRKPVIIHLEELETLEAIAERHGDFAKLLNDWQGSNRRAGPLKNYLIAAGVDEHPSRLNADRAHELLRALRDRFGHAA
jgi:hypothetical protein